MKTYKLKKPVQLPDGSSITELTFREEVTAGDMRGITIRENMLWDDIIKIAARLCGRPEADINRLAFEDFTEVSGTVTGFFGSGPATGTTP